MEAIDLDPCSNSNEIPNVPAARHYIVQDNVTFSRDRVTVQSYSELEARWLLVSHFVEDLRSSHISMLSAFDLKKFDTTHPRKGRDLGGHIEDRWSSQVSTLRSLNSVPELN